MKNYFLIFLLIASALLLSACSKNSTPEIPDGFEVISEETKLNIPDIDGLNTLLIECLEEIGVEEVVYSTYGNFSDISISLSIDAFVVTDTDIQLKASFTYMKSSKSWSCMFIMDAQDSEKCYYAPKIKEVVDLYDYKTGKLISKKSMSHDEFNEKINLELEEKLEEIDKEFNEKLNEIF